MEVSEDLRATSSPVGTLPSRNVIDHNATDKSALGFKGRYEWNEWVVMGHGDVLLLSTDGLLEHGSETMPYVPDRLEQRLREVKSGTAKEIFEAIKHDLLSFSEPSDDISVVVIKRL